MTETYYPTGRGVRGRDRLRTTHYVVGIVANVMLIVALLIVGWSALRDSTAVVVDNSPKTVDECQAGPPAGVKWPSCDRYN